MAEAPALAQEILREIRREHPNLPLVLDDSGEPMAWSASAAPSRSSSSTCRPRRAARPYRRVSSRSSGAARACTAAASTRCRRSNRMGVRLRLAPVRRDRPARRDPAPRCTELSTAGYEYLDGPGRPVRARLRGGGGQTGGRTAPPPAPAHGTPPRRSTHRGDPADALAERAARIGWPLPEKVAVGVLLRPAREASHPRRAGGAARHGVRAAPHGRPRTGRRGRPDCCTGR